MSVVLGTRTVGSDEPCLVVAEAGVNHNGDISRALDLVDAAADACADVVKFQTFSTDLLVAPHAASAAYQYAATGERYQADLLRSLELPADAWSTLACRAKDRGILFMSSAFDAPSVDLLVSLGVPALKFGSGELTNRDLLARGAASGLPLLVSTGMATMDEVDAAVAELGPARDRLILLHCVSAYPAPPADANLAVISTMTARFGVPVGYSDHHVGTSIALGAVALGATVLEKHLTLDRKSVGPDHAASLEPDAFATMVSDIRAVDSARGHGRKERVASENDTAMAARRSLFLRVPLGPGAEVTEDALRALRPGTGLPPSSLSKVVGRRLVRAVSVEEPLNEDMFE